MYRVSESIAKVGSEFLLDIMSCETPIYFLYYNGSMWLPLECVVLAITNEQMMVRYETRSGWPETDSLQGIKMHWVEISGHNVNWFTDGEEAEFESDERNDIIREGNRNEA